MARVCTQPQQGSTKISFFTPKINFFFKFLTIKQLGKDTGMGTGSTLFFNL
jgi:hypothetical protein